MRWNGRNYRPAGIRKISVNPSRENLIKPLGKKGEPILVMSFQGGQTVESTPTPTPTPTPVPPSVEVSISPTGATQYENVVLTASTTGTSPTFIWTLTDFYDTSGNTISSYTGSVLTEGYFSSTGSSNVSVVVIADEGSGSTSTFVVSEFDPTTISGLTYWYDFSDDTTITYRTGTTYVESVDDKSGNAYSVSNTTASLQPSISASTINPSLNSVYLDGVDDYLFGDKGVEDNVSGFTTLVLGTFDYNPNKAGFSHYMGNLPSGFNFESRYFRHGTNNSPQVWDARYSYDGDIPTWSSTLSTDTPQTSLAILRQNNLGYSISTRNGLSPDVSASYTAYGFLHRYLTFGTVPNQFGSPGTGQYFKGQIHEFFHFDNTTLTDSDTEKLNRYLQYKWFGSMTY